VVCRIPGELTKNFSQIYGDLIGRGTNVTYNGPKRNNFVYFCKSINLGGLEPVGLSRQCMSSVGVGWVRFGWIRLGSVGLDWDVLG
jgi:hypothetical protein